MADNLQTIFNVLPLLFDEQLYRQWNRTTVLLGELQARPGAVQEYVAKNVAFATEFSGATASTVAEGSDIAATEYATDINQPAVFSWATYRSSFQVTEVEIDAARQAMGSAAALRDIFEARILSAGATIAAQIEADALTGTGVDVNGNATLVGIYGGALTASGAYGGINANTYPEWASNVLTNGGTTRALTPDLAEQADQNIFIGSSIPWNLVMTSAGIARKYTSMFTQGPAGTNIPLIRMNDQAGAPVYGLSPQLDAQGQLDSIMFKGRKVLRNRLNPTGKLALLNTDFIKIKYLPRSLSAADKEFLRMMGIEGSSGGGASGGGGPIQATGIPMRITNIAKTGDSLKVSCRVTLAMGILRRNAQALLQDLAES
jgi:hypothetical protein